MNRRPLIILVLFAVVAQEGLAATYHSGGNTNYYVDQVQGDDTNNGTSSDGAWKTIGRVNQMRFAQGDVVHFAAGQVFRGTLMLRLQAGSLRRPIEFRSFGEGKATLHGGKGSAIVLTRCKHILIKELNLRGLGRNEGSEDHGLLIKRSAAIQVRSVDIRGFLRAGVHIASGRGIKLTEVYAAENGFAGIMAGDGTLERSISNLTISQCITENNPGNAKFEDRRNGSGILVCGVSSSLIEHCESTSNGSGVADSGTPAGIYVWNSDTVVVRHCISHHNKASAKGAGGGFVLGGGVSGSLLAFNLSYGNAGSGYSFRQFKSAPAWEKNTMRFNFSVNDGKSGAGSIGIEVDNNQMTELKIYNNTIISNQAHSVSMTVGDNRPRVDGILIRNNIFMVTAKIQSFVAGGSELSFSNNLYWSLEAARAGSAHPQIPKDARAIRRDPLIHFPLMEGKIINEPLDPRTFRYGRLLNRSPCIGTGIRIAEPGVEDFYGNRLRSSRRPCVGAHDRK